MPPVVYYMSQMSSKYGNFVLNAYKLELDKFQHPKFIKKFKATKLIRVFFRFITLRNNQNLFYPNCSTSGQLNSWELKI